MNTEKRDKIDLAQDEKVAKQFRHYTNVKDHEEEVNTGVKEFFRYNDALDSVRNTDINNSIYIKNGEHTLSKTMLHKLLEITEEGVLRHAC